MAAGLYCRRQPHAVHSRAREAWTIHARRPCGGLRASATAAPAVSARCFRPGDPGLRERDGRRDEPGARRCAAARHGRGDDRIHRADQLRLGHAVDRYGAINTIREGRSDLVLAGGAEALSHTPLMFRRSAVDWYARLAGARRPLVAHRRRARIPALLPQAGDRAGARPDRPRGRAQHGTNRRDPRPSLRHDAARRRPVRGRKPTSAWRGRRRKDGSRAKSSLLSVATARTYDHDDGVRPDSTVEKLGQAQAGIRTALGQGDARATARRSPTAPRG